MASVGGDSIRLRTKYLFYLNQFFIIRSLLLCIFIAVLWIPPAQAEDSCDSWFVGTGAKPETPGCEMDCASAATDMSTFRCPSFCPNYCKLNRKCSIDPFWQKALQGNSAPFKALTNDEKYRVTEALSKIPEKLQPSNLKAIGKSSTTDFLSPTNPAMSSGEFIILFPAAFSTDLPLERILLHEIAHEMVAREWSKVFSDYKKISGWDKASGNSSRPGEFVENDSRDSADEDFANNIEYFVFAPKKLKSVSPNLYSWISKNLKTQLKLEGGCNDSKSRNN